MSSLKREAATAPAHVRDGAAVPRTEVAGRPLARLQWAASAAARAAVSEVDPRAAIQSAVADAAAAFGRRPSQVAVEVLDRALCEPLLAQMPPDLTLQTHAALLAGAAGARDVFIWWRDGRGLRHVGTSSDASAKRATRTLAKLVLEGGEPVVAGTRSVAVAVPVRRSGVPVAALVARAAESTDIGLLERAADRAALRLAPVQERRALLERAGDRERLLLEAAEKRLVRLGYDLHDGPLQDVAALAAEVRLVAKDVEEVVDEHAAASVADAFASLLDRIRQLERGLRSVSQSSESSAALRDSLAAAIRGEAERVERASAIKVEVETDPDLPGLTDSQRIALYRVTQEALTNVRDHSGAANVSVTIARAGDGVRLVITDDGCGFDVDRTLKASARRGRLGLVGIFERVRLLGGVLRVVSAPGAGTTLEVVLARFTPDGSA